MGGVVPLCPRLLDGVGYTDDPGFSCVYLRAQPQKSSLKGIEALAANISPQNTNAVQSPMRQL